jgi:hypothetical protein
MWSVIELFCAILCASLPAIRPLLVQYLPAYFTTNKGSSYRLEKSNEPARRNHGNKFKELPDIPPDTIVATEVVNDKMYDKRTSRGDSDIEITDLELQSLKTTKSGV